MQGPLEAPSRIAEQRAWYFYDWANSAFASTVVTLFLGPYLTAVAKAGAGADGLLHIAGLAFDPRSYWSYLVSLSVLTQVFVLPLIGSIADFGQRKKEFLAVLAYIGAFATIAMFFIQGSRFLLGGALFLIANLAFGASIVIYNAFLPEISTPEERDSVSSKGWGIGYLGGGILLGLNLAFFAKAPAWGLSEAFAVRVSLASAGVWWALWTLIPLARLRNRGALRELPAGENILRVGFDQFRHTLLSMRNYPQTLTFLIAYLLYNDAIQTVIALAGQFGSDELHMPMSQLTLAILMVQFVAFAGAMLFNFLSARIGSKRSVQIALVIWALTLCYIYLSVRTPLEFFIMAAIVGVIMGGSQALSRALFSLMIPVGKEAEYFSVYEISDKGTSWLGPLVFGFALDRTGSYRTAILSLIVFFVAGLILLSRVNVERAAAEAHGH